MHVLLQQPRHHMVIAMLLAMIIFWMGRLSVYSSSVSFSPIQEVAEINPKVPIVNILAIQGDQLIGYVSDPKTRIKSWDKSVAVPNHENRFVLDISHFGFLPRIPVIEHHVPEWAIYVASRSGKNFYRVDSPSGKRISVPNRVYFKTREEAIQKGFKESK